MILYFPMLPKANVFNSHICVGSKGRTLRDSNLTLFVFITISQNQGT